MNQLTPGAYVIRNKSTSSVLHIQDSDVKASVSAVTLFGQHENNYHDQQIWWVEPLPGCNPAGSGGMLYSITNTASGRSLDLNPGFASDGTRTVSSTQGKITVRSQHGAPWQRWRIAKIQDSEDGASYKIVNDHNDGALCAYHSLFSSSVATREFRPGDKLQCWEFIFPMVASPSGWFQIRSTAGEILHQPCHSSPPVVIPYPDILKPSQCHESWGMQWTLIHAQNFAPRFPGLEGMNTWCIMNRLTKTLLGNVKYNLIGGERFGVAAWEFDTSDVLGHTWKLELDAACNWKIINYRTGFLLERASIATSNDTGMEVICLNRAFSYGETNKTWVITSPVVEISEENPPDYTT